MLKLNLQYFGTWFQELTHWKIPWCWERLKAGGEGDDRGWDGWIGSPTLGAYSNSCPSSQCCHPTILSSIVSFSSSLQSFLVSGSFPMSRFFASGGQSTGVSALESFLPKKSQGWSPSEWTGWISLQSKGLSSLFQHHSSKASILKCSAFLMVQLSYPYMTTGKTIALTRWNFVGKVMSLIFNMLSRLVIAFLPRSLLISRKFFPSSILISRLQSRSAVILESPESLSLFPLFLHLFNMKWRDQIPWS